MTGSAPDALLSDPAEVGRALGRAPPWRTLVVDESAPAGDATYDYILAGAALFAAPDPAAALRELAGRLAPGGAIGVAVAGRIARLPLAHTRELFTLLCDPRAPAAEEAPRLLRSLPASAWLKRHPPAEDAAALARLVAAPPEPRLTLAELAAIAAEAGLALAAVAPRADYEVAGAIADPALRQRVAALPDALRWAFAELWSASITTHRAFLVRERPPEPPRAAPAGQRALAEQYEAYPYPARDPAEETRRLHVGSPSNLPELDQFVFGGRRAARRALKVLSAGGGTGDGSIMLAQQLALADPDASVIHLDLSSASLAIARARAAARCLSNIAFVQGSLLELNELGLGAFDYIDCCGVLHHLEDPGAGLSALAAALKLDGGIGLMLYGAVGRTGVYPLQQMLRWIAPAAGLPAAERIDIARRLIKAIPPSNLFAADPALNDHVQGGDAGVFDLFLHSRDRAFRVPEVYALAAAAGLRVTGLLPPGAYRPGAYLKDPGLRARARGLDPQRQAAAAELLCGRLTKHVCYLVRADNPVAPPRLDEADVVPVFRSAEEGRRLAAWPGGQFTARMNGLGVAVGLPPPARTLIEGIDGETRLGALLSALPEKEGARAALAALATLLDLGIVFLRRAA